MRKILKYTFSLLLLLPLTVSAQDSTKLFSSVTFTADLGAASIQFFDEQRTSYAFAVDMQIRKNYFVGMIGGWQQVKKAGDFFNYRSSGIFLKSDFKYDFLKKKDSDKTSIAYISGRLSYSRFNQSIEDVVLRNTYWGKETFDLQKQKLNALWLEIGGGIRADMFHNFMLGWNLHIRVMALKPDYYLIPPKYIPGFGSGEETVVFGFEYTLSYRIPLAQ
ncbi:MAG: DUF6048 family protein [Bacteroidales bacterium]|nr:DUF6048 family protein [Bacteroidales bacterium]MCF8386980.1 DUF6048 family protein [Bacteroidales bacterium]MCF8397009.1 DUF6048 family protein [Bacteroidales bacterium]